MLKKLIVALMLIIPMGLCAQQKFGHVNSSAILPLMPEYTTAQTELQNLEKQYTDEIQRMNDELNKKSEEFEAQRATLPANIAERRQAELQDLYNRMQEYYQEGQRHMDQASAEKMNVISEKLRNAIKEVGVAGGYVYIMDVAAGVPYISETLSTDVTETVKAKLGIK
ncbi:MAG: OmpH family outer membrane protein [Bacteroidaceae bacterium]|nr:OmpH family outer membrane protein [Bacteroidaceae bacterium]